MTQPDVLFEEVIDLVADEYSLCVKKARKLFYDEQAIQSASATMFINATKEKSSVTSYINSLKDRIARIDKDAIPSAVSVWEWHFRDFVEEFGDRMRGAIRYYVESGRTNEEIEKAVLDRVYRLRSAELPADERDELFKQMFGDETND